MSSSPKFLKESLRDAQPTSTPAALAEDDLLCRRRSPSIPDFMDLRPSVTALNLPHAQARKDRDRLSRASWAFTTRRIPAGAARGIIEPGSYKPSVGDLVLARVDSIGHHKGLQLVNGRRRIMFEGDEIVVAFGNRYASSQFESYVPDSMGPCHLVAGGGIASRAVSWHSNIARGPTHISPIGLLSDKYDRPLNLKHFGLPAVTHSSEYQPTTIALIGTSMDAGKTTTAAYLARGLVDAGLRVGYAKVTGTGAGGDTWLLKDAGADPVLDFTDAGLPTTFMEDQEKIEEVLLTLIGHCTQEGVDAVLLEIADGVLQRETAALLRSPVFAQATGGIVLAAQDSMGAAAGVDWLSNCMTPTLALSGKLTAAPLQVKEAQAATGLPIFNLDDLATGRKALELLGKAQQHLARMRVASNNRDRIETS